MLICAKEGKSRMHVAKGVSLIELAVSRKCLVAVSQDDDEADLLLCVQLTNTAQLSRSRRCKAEKKEGKERDGESVENPIAFDSRVQTPPGLPYAKAKFWQTYTLRTMSQARCLARSAAHAKALSIQN
jgi:hypothetical protein